MDTARRNNGVRRLGWLAEDEVSFLGSLADEVNGPKPALLWYPHQQQMSCNTGAGEERGASELKSTK